MVDCMVNEAGLLLLITTKYIKYRSPLTEGLSQSKAANKNKFRVMAVVVSVDSSFVC